MKRLVVFLFLTVFVAFSCNKDNGIVELTNVPQNTEKISVKITDKNTNSLEQKVENTVNYFGLSVNEIDSIGIMHNNFLRNGVKDLTIYSEDLEASLYNNFISIAPDDIGNNEIIKVLDFGKVGFQIEEGVNYFNNPLTLDLYTDLISHSHLDSIENYQTYLEYINSIKETVNENLSDGDKEFMLICLSVAKHSTKMWLDVDKGGEGFYDKLHPRQKMQLRWSWRAAIAGDISGAAEAFMEFGVGLAVPGTNAAIAATIGFSAAFGSAMGGLLG